MLAILDSLGCPDTVFGTVVIEEILIISNVFTPNGDGSNDYFFIPIRSSKEFH